MSQPSFDTLANSTQTFVNVGRDRLIAATKGRTEAPAKLLHDAAVASDCKLVQLRPRVLLAALEFFNAEPVPAPVNPPAVSQSQLPTSEVTSTAATPASASVPATGSPAATIDDSQAETPTVPANQPDPLAAE